MSTFDATLDLARQEAFRRRQLGFEPATVGPPSPDQAAASAALDRRLAAERRRRELERRQKWLDSRKDVLARYRDAIEREDFFTEQALREDAKKAEFEVREGERALQFELDKYHNQYGPTDAPFPPATAANAPPDEPYEHQAGFAERAAYGVARAADDYVPWSAPMALQELIGREPADVIRQRELSDQAAAIQGRRAAEAFAASGGVPAFAGLSGADPLAQRGGEDQLRVIRAAQQATGERPEFAAPRNLGETLGDVAGGLLPMVGELTLGGKILGPAATRFGSVVQEGLTWAGQAALHGQDPVHAGLMGGAVGAIGRFLPHATPIQRAGAVGAESGLMYAAAPEEASPTDVAVQTLLPAALRGARWAVDAATGARGTNGRMPETNGRMPAEPWIAGGQWIDDALAQARAEAGGAMPTPQWFADRVRTPEGGAFGLGEQVLADRLAPVRRQLDTMRGTNGRTPAGSRYSDPGTREAELAAMDAGMRMQPTRGEQVDALAAELGRIPTKAEVRQRLPELSAEEAGGLLRARFGADFGRQRETAQRESQLADQAMGPPSPEELDAALVQARQEAGTGIRGPGTGGGIRPADKPANAGAVRPIDKPANAGAVRPIDKPANAGGTRTPDTRGVTGQVGAKTGRGVDPELTDAEFRRIIEEAGLGAELAASAKRIEAEARALQQNKPADAGAVRPFDQPANAGGARIPQPWNPPQARVGRVGDVMVDRVTGEVLPEPRATVTTADKLTGPGARTPAPGPRLRIWNEREGYTDASSILTEFKRQTGRPAQGNALDEPDMRGWPDGETRDFGGGWRLTKGTDAAGRGVITDVQAPPGTPFRMRGQTLTVPEVRGAGSGDRGAGSGETAGRTPAEPGARTPAPGSSVTLGAGLPIEQGKELIGRLGGRGKKSLSDEKSEIERRQADLLAANPRMSKDDASYMEWRENANRVAEDPQAASSLALDRARAYQDAKYQSLLRKRQSGQAVPDEVLTGIESEKSWYQQILNERGYRPGVGDSTDAQNKPANAGASTENVGYTVGGSGAGERVPSAGKTTGRTSVPAPRTPDPGSSRITLGSGLPFERARELVADLRQRTRGLTWRKAVSQLAGRYGRDLVRRSEQPLAEAWQYQNRADRAGRSVPPAARGVYDGLLKELNDELAGAVPTDVARAARVEAGAGRGARGSDAGVRREERRQTGVLRDAQLGRQSIVTIADAEGWLADRGLSRQYTSLTVKGKPALEGEPPVDAIGRLMKHPDFRSLPVFDKVRLAAQLQRTWRESEYSPELSVRTQNNKTADSPVWSGDTVRGCDQYCFDCYAVKGADQAAVSHQVPVRAELKGTLPTDKLLRLGTVGEPAKDWGWTAQQVYALMDRSRARGYDVSPEKNVYVISKLLNLEGFDPKATPNLHVSIDPLYPAHARQSMANVIRLLTQHPGQVNIALRIRSLKSNNPDLMEMQQWAVDWANRLGLDVLETRMRFKGKYAYELLDLDPESYHFARKQQKLVSPALKEEAKRWRLCDEANTGECKGCMNCVKLVGQRTENIASAASAVRSQRLGSGSLRGRPRSTETLGENAPAAFEKSRMGPSPGAGERGAGSGEAGTMGRTPADPGARIPAPGSSITLGSGLPFEQGRELFGKMRGAKGGDRDPSTGEREKKTPEPGARTPSTGEREKKTPEPGARTPVPGAFNPSSFESFYDREFRQGFAGTKGTKGPPPKDVIKTFSPGEAADAADPVAYTEHLASLAATDDSILGRYKDIRYKFNPTLRRAGMELVRRQGAFARGRTAQAHAELAGLLYHPDEPLSRRVPRVVREVREAARARSLSQAWDKLGHLTTRFTQNERREMIHYREKTGDPEVQGDTFEALSERMSPQAREAADKVGELLEKYRAEHALYGMDAEYRKNYVTHFYEPPKGKTVAEAEAEAIEAMFASGKIPRQPKFQEFNPFARPRFWDTYEAALKEAGLKPKYNDLYEITKEHQAIINENTSLKILHEELRQIATADGTPVIVAQNEQGKRRGDYADYIEVTHPTFQMSSREVAVDSAGRPVIRPDGQLEMKTVWRPAKVHRDVMFAMKMLLEPVMGGGGEIRGGVVSTMEKFNAVTKVVQLSMSLFHALELGTQSVISGNWRFVKGLRKGMELARDPEFMRDAAAAGLQIGAPSDVEVSHFANFSKGLAALVETGPTWAGATVGLPRAGAVVGKAAAAPVRAVAYAKRLNDRFLWDWVHTGLKAEMYHRWLVRSLQKNERLADHKRQDLRDVRRDVANYVNHTIGGINWKEAFNAPPRVQQGLRWLLLAPDWTFSQIAGMTDMAKGVLPGGPSRALGRAARRHRAVEVAVAFTAIQAFNQLFSGHWSWENDIGHEWEVDMGERHPETGRKMYMVPFKSVREITRWFTDPSSQFQSKLAPGARNIARQAVGSGEKFPVPWAKMKDEGATDWETIPARIKDIASQIRPFSFKGESFGYAIPKRQGWSYGRTRQEMVNTLRDGGKDQQETMRRILQAAADNRLDVRQLTMDAMARVRGEAYGAIAEAIRRGDREEVAVWVAKARRQYGSQPADMWRAVAGRLSDTLRADRAAVQRAVGYYPKEFSGSRKRWSIDEAMERVR